MKSGQITAVHRDNKQKQRYHIDLDGEYAFTVHEDILVKYNLFKGTDVDETFYCEVLVAEERHKAYLGALKYLGMRPRTRSQLQAYLLDKGFDAKVADEICQRCEDHGYIDDEAFAKQWVEERLRLKPRSSYMLRMELAQRGVDKAIAEDAVQGVSREAELEAARALIEKKARRITGAPNPDEERKLLAMLMRRGFSHSTIHQVGTELRQRRDEER